MSGSVSDTSMVSQEKPRRLRTSLRRKAPFRRKASSKNKKRSVFHILQREHERLEKESKRDATALTTITCNNVIYYVLLYSAILCCRAAISTYIEGVTGELRKKYSFTESHISLIKGTQVIGLVASLLVIALFGRSYHKPLIQTCGVLVCSLGAIVCPIPYFVEKTSGRLTSNCSLVSPYGFDNLPLASYAQACQYGQWNMSYLSPCSACLTNTEWLYSRQNALSLLCVGGFLIGLGTGLFVTTGFVYVEESGSRKNGPIFYGIFLSMSGFGHFLGSCMAWWFLSYTEDLNENDEPRLDWTIKAWWLGFVFFCVFLFICSWLFLLFPKWISEPEWSTTLRSQRIRRLAKRLEQEKLRKRRKAHRKKACQEQRRTKSSRKDSNRKSCDNVYTPDLVSSKSDTVFSVSTQNGGVAPTFHPSNGSGSDLDANLPHLTDDVFLFNENDSETVNAEPATSTVSYQHTSSGNGSSLGMIAEEDIDIYRLPSSTLPEPDDPQSSQLDDAGSPVWPLHNPTDEANRHSRVVTFASGASESVVGHSANVTGYIGNRKQVSARIQRKEISRKLGKSFTALKRTVLAPVFALALIGTTLSAYQTAGYRSDVVHFVEVQYGQPTIYAWFYTAGLCYSLAEIVGPLVAGIVVHKLRLSLFRQAKMVICLLIADIVCFFLIFPINLPGGGFKWPSSNNSLISSLKPSCETKCDCLDVQLDPVCSLDGIKYFSACHAGCTQLFLQNASVIYTNCLCSLESSVSSSFCSGEFPVYGAFLCILFISVVAHSMGQVNVVLIFLRSVHEMDRLLALSLAIWVIVVCAFVPGPPVFEALEKISCTAFRLNCYSEDTCWLYNLDQYRYVIHGANIAFQLAAIVLFFATLYFLRLDHVKPVGYGKDEYNRHGVHSPNEMEARSSRVHTMNELGGQSMMEMVQSRIASNLLASQAELMKTPETKKEHEENKNATVSTYITDKISSFTDKSSDITGKSSYSKQDSGIEMSNKSIRTLSDESTSYSVFERKSNEGELENTAEATSDQNTGDLEDSDCTERSVVTKKVITDNTRL